MVVFLHVHSYYKFFQKKIFDCIYLTIRPELGNFCMNSVSQGIFIQLNHLRSTYVLFNIIVRSLFKSSFPVTFKKKQLSPFEG